MHRFLKCKQTTQYEGIITKIKVLTLQPGIITSRISSFKSIVICEYHLLLMKLKEQAYARISAKNIMSLESSISGKGLKEGGGNISS